MSSDVLKSPGAHCPNARHLHPVLTVHALSVSSEMRTGQAGLSLCWCPVPNVHVIIVSQSGEGSVVAILAAQDAEGRDVTPLLIARASEVWAEMDRVCLT